VIRSILSNTKRKDNVKVKLPPMNKLEKEIFSLANEMSPQGMYSMGLEEFAEKIFIPSAENIDQALEKIANLKRECGLSPKNVLIKKFLDSIETTLMFDEPGPGVGQVVEAISSHLIKEGINEERLQNLVDSLSEALKAWQEYLEGKEFSVPVKILAQYQILGAMEILDLLLKEAKTNGLTLKVTNLKEVVSEFAQKYSVPGFTQGEFSEVIRIMKDSGADLGREKFYDRALKFGFDYTESPEELEEKALGWIEEDLPKMQKAMKTLSEKLNCPNNPEAVNEKLKARPDVSGKAVLDTTIRIRPIIQELAAESLVRMSPKYNAEVKETPPYLSAIVPTGAATGFDAYTIRPQQIFWITTDPKRAPPGGFADLVQLLVHEEYGHCVHFSNTANNFAAKPTLTETLFSLHGGTTSEGLAFQRELEFLDLVEEISKKPESKRTRAEKAFVDLTQEYGGFEQFLLELEYVTYQQRIIRFLRVVGDARINSGKQNLPDFLEWAEEHTGLAQRTVFYQIFPAHESIFPGYATCYAVVGQDIRAIQSKFKNDRKKLAKFNAYASSMGYPARSVYIARLRDYARKLGRSGIRAKRKSKTTKKRSKR
jgi:Bacterial protein of unknown function (DUF885)